MAPMSNAERKRKYRQNLTDEKRKQLKDQDRIRKKHKRATTVLTPEQINDKRIKARERQRKCREKALLNKPTTLKLPFKTKQTKGKAVKKVKNALPKTPGKRTEVIKEIVYSLSPKSKQEVVGKTRHIPYNSALPDKTIQLVKEFYESDENSRMMPGKKDVVTTRNEKGKEKMRKRLLLDDIISLHTKFCKEYPDHPIGKSKFFQLRPFWIIPVQKQSQEVCMCSYHENINMLLNSLNNHARTIKLKLDYKSTNSADNIWEKTVCNKYNKNCVWRKCDDCGAEKVCSLFPFENQSKFLEVYQWESVAIERENKPPIKVVRKVTHSLTIKEIMTRLEEQLKDFSIHNYTNIVQLHNFKCAKKNLKPGEIIISEDFSENYSLKHQCEIMSAHWSQEELSLFCATVHYNENDTHRFTHYVLCSDDLTHDKNTIYFYNNFIINHLKEIGVPVTHVHYWSDGPSSQFKNQYNFSNLLFQKEDYGFTADWNFFATSHGKGENDGVGGDVKNSVWRKVLQHKEVVGDLDSFVRVAQAKYPNIIVRGFTKENIKEATIFLKDRYSQHSKAIPETRKLHFVEIVGSKINGKYISPSCPCHRDESKSTAEIMNQDSQSSTPVIKPKISQFYYVRYTFLDKSGKEIQKVLPALCIKNDIEEHLFGFMKSINASNSYLYVLDENDKAWINEEDICELIPFPDITRRGEYKWMKKL